MTKFLEKKLLNTFKGRPSIKRIELLDFYRSYEPDLKESTFAWRIHDLKQKNILQTIGLSIYTLTQKPEFEPNLDIPGFSSMFNIIWANFQESKYCVWDTQWLNSLMLHQSSAKMTIVEIEEGLEDSLYYAFKDASINPNIFINPKQRDIDIYISESYHPIIIKRLITRSPLEEVELPLNPGYIPRIEKILVDLFAEEELFHVYQNTELVHIYEEAIRQYHIDYTKLFAYAKRRKKDKKIRAFLYNHLPSLVDTIPND